MRVLIVSAAILACACGRPSGLIAPIGPAFYTGATYGDAAAAATNARVQLEDSARAAVDAQREWTEQAVGTHNDNVRELNDQAREINEERFWNAEEQKWQSFDAIKTAESEIDGAAAAASPAIVKAAVAGPAVLSAPAVLAAPAVVAQRITVPQAYAAAPSLVSQQVIAQPIAYSALVQPQTKTIVTQSLSQTHPSPAAAVIAEPIVQAAPAIISEPIVKSAPIIEAAPIVEAAPIIESAPIVETVAAPAQKTIVTQSLSQTHPSPLIAQPILKSVEIAQPILKSVEIAQPYINAVEIAQPSYTVVQPETKSVLTSSLSQIHGGYAQPAANIIAVPYNYNAPIYKQEIVASSW